MDDIIVIKSVLEDMHREIGEMSDRLRTFERALNQLHHRVEQHINDYDTPHAL